MRFLLLFGVLVSAASGDLFEKKSIQLDGILAAFGDFDSDKFTDLFVINSNRQSFEIQKASGVDHYSFTKQANLTCNCSKNEEIVGLLPSDFHGDAKMDVIVITQFKPNTYGHGKWSSNLFNIYLVQGSTFSLECKNLENQNILFQSRIQPLLLGIHSFRRAAR